MKRGFSPACPKPAKTQSYLTSYENTEKIKIPRPKRRLSLKAQKVGIRVISKTRKISLIQPSQERPEPGRSQLKMSMIFSSRLILILSGTGLNGEILPLIPCIQKMPKKSGRRGQKRPNSV